MSNPVPSPYKDALSTAMESIAAIEDSIFIGQQIVYAGNPMSTTLGGVSKDKMIELPVMEETQMGMTLGLAMTGKVVVSFYPRWDFIILASNQLINHVDKFKHMTGKDVHIMIRLGKGSDKPLDPGHQHKGNYFSEYQKMCPNIKFYDLRTPEDIAKPYQSAMDNSGIHVLVEYPELYYA